MVGKIGGVRWAGRFGVRVTIGRFWVPRGAELFTESGFLPDPEAQNHRFLNEQIVRTEDLVSSQCLILLGDAGAGKSTEARRIFKATAASPGETGAECLWFDLAEYGSEERLVREVFQENETLRDWLAGEGTLTVTFDSVDECLIRIDTLNSLLPRQLERLPTNRLKVRFVSRPAVWPGHLEVELAALWETVNVHKLAPFRRCDVLEFARESGIDAEKFIHTIEESNAAVFAGHPVTLGLLIELFRRDGNITTDRVQLYARGCAWRAQEPNVQRRARASSRRLSVPARVAVARRIAALTLLCKRSSVLLRSDLTLDETQIVIEEIAGGHEQTDGGRVDVAPADIVEVLDTALFTPVASDSVTVAHRTFAEYLAASYLVNRGFNEDQMLSLLGHHTTARRLIPQLRGVAAWLGHLDPTWIEQLVAIDPLTALGANLRSAPAATRARVLQTLLESFDKGTLVDLNSDGDLNYRELRYDGMAAHLDPYVRDRDRSLVSRRFAMEIIEACEVRELCDRLIDVALDRSEDPDIRGVAVARAKRLVSTAQRERLRQLLGEGPETDPRDELFGYALTLLWPDHLSPADLFALLRAPRRDSWFGSYGIFLYRLAAQLDDAVLQEGLRWVEQQPASYAMNDRLALLLRSILSLGWKRVRDGLAVSDAFARAALSRLRNHEDVFASKYGHGNAPDLEREDRRLLVDLLTRTPWPPSDSISLVFGADLVSGADLPWLVTLYRHAADASQRTRLLVVIEEATRTPEALASSSNVGAALQLAVDNEEARRALGQLIGPIPLDSEYARSSREQQRKWQVLQAEMDARQRPKRAPPFSRTSFLQRQLEGFVAGDRKVWPYAAVALIAHEPAGDYDFGNVDIVGSEGWLEQDASTRKQLCQAAKEYLHAERPPAGWAAANSIPGIAVAGYRALLLLERVAPDTLDSLSTQVWEQWAETIVGWKFTSASPYHQALLKRVYSIAPRQVYAALRLLFVGERGSTGRCFFVRDFRGLWDSSLAELAVGELRRPEVSADAFDIVLAELLEVDASGAFEYALALATTRNLYCSSPSRRVIAAKQLLRSTPERSFADVWPILKEDNAFGRSVIEGLAMAELRRSLSTRLQAADAAELYVWLSLNYPPETDPDHDGVYHVGPREAVAELRAHTLRDLRARGTRDSFQALQWAQRQLPPSRSWDWHLAEAEENMLVRSWLAPKPAELLSMAENRARRLVRSSTELQHVVKEALRVVQRNLLGATSEIALLWETVRNETGVSIRGQNVKVPKDENTLADYLKIRLEDYFKDRQIVVNREVEVRRGSETDLMVEAIPPPEEPESIARVIVEVKGCWHHELQTAMETQLSARYLLPGHCSHGVYLVGWYLCERWLDDNYQKRATPSWTIDAARAFFEAQAKALSTGTVHLESVVLDLRHP